MEEDIRMIEDIQGTKITIKDGNVRKTYDFATLFRIDEDNLSKEFAEQASLYGYFSVLMAKAEHEAAVMEFGKDQEYAIADTSLRDEMTEAGEKYTEGLIRSLVLADEEYGKKAMSAIDSQFDYKLLKAIVSALQQRAEMLVSLGAHVRHEIDQTGMNIKEREFKNTEEKMRETLRNARKTKEQV